MAQKVPTHRNLEEVPDMWCIWRVQVFAPGHVRDRLPGRQSLGLAQYSSFLCYRVPTISGMEEVNASKIMSLKSTCLTAGKKELQRMKQGKMGSCAPQGLMHTNPDSEVTVNFSTAPESFEMKPIADGRKWLRGKLRGRVVEGKGVCHEDVSQMFLQAPLQSFFPSVTWLPHFSFL